MDYVFIVNPVAGAADARRTVVPAIIEAAKALGLPYEILFTEHPGHGQELAKQVAARGTQTHLYACGGDGTFQETLQGVFGCENVQVGCVPCGSGNDFVRNFSAPEGFLDLRAQLLGRGQKIDLIETNFGYSAGICSVGLDAQVAYGIPAFRRIPLCGGPMAYKLSILQQLCRPLGHRLRIEADGEIVEQDCLMAAACNGIAYGGGFFAAPPANLCDGYLDLIIVKKVGYLKIAQIVSIYKSGRHFCGGKILPELRDVFLYRRVKEVSITPTDGPEIILNVDGECAPSAGLHARILPMAGSIILPQGVQLRQTEQKEAAL